MATIAFDTLKYAKRLKDAGFTETQAETLASVEAELIESSLASKRDLKDVEAKLSRDIEALRADLQRDLKEMEYRLTIRLGGLIALAVATVAALVKLL